MPGKHAKELGVKGEPPDPGSSEWTKLCKRLKKLMYNERPFCGMAGGVAKDGWPCESTFITEANGRCNRHCGPKGGKKGKRAMEHHNFRHGRLTALYKALPGRFHEAYEASLTDPDLLSLRSDIALSDARATELAGRLKTGESAERWREVAGTAIHLLSLLELMEPDLDKVREGLRRIRGLTEDTAHDEQTWSELKQMSQHRRRLVDAERKRLRDMHAYLAADEALVLVTRLVDVVVRHVDDQNALRAIVDEVERITDQRPADRARREILVEA